MKEKVDAIIVGSGVSGSIAGAYLAKAGLKTVIFESTADIGGKIYGSYKLGDCTTDKHCHIPFSYFSLNGGGWWVKAAREVGADIQWMCLPNSQIYFKGKLITMPYCTSGRAFAKFICGLMPLPEKDQRDLAQVFDDAINMPQEELWSSKMDEMPFHTWLEERTDNPLVKQLFKVLNDVSIVGGHDSSSVTGTLSVMIGILAGWINCTYTTDGAADQIPKGFCRVVTEHGGQVLMEHTVTSVIIENGQAKGVVVKDPAGKEKTYVAKHVLLGARYNALKKMLGTHVPKEVTEACQSLDKAGEIGLDVHFALKKKIANPIACQIVVIDDNLAYEGAIFYPDHWSPSLVPLGKQVIQAEKFFSPKQFKERGLEEWADYLRDMCEKVHPGFKDAIELEHINICHSAVYYTFYYGPKVPIEYPGISNLYFIGDYTSAPGLVSERAASSATIAAKKILSDNT